MLDKLKIGILDLLTILVPGGFLLFILSDRLMEFTTNNWKGYPIVTNPWLLLGIGFAVAYILGHFIFLVGSFLDDLVYEKVRRIYWHDHAKLVSYVVMIKEQKTGRIERKTISAWKWACAYLLSTQPAIYAEVERHMAESKFFRSLIIVLLAAFFFFPSAERSVSMIVIFLVLIVLSLVRYLTQRQKSLETAYHGIITTSGVVLPPEPDPLIYASIKKDLVHPNEKLYERIKENDEKDKVLRPDKWFYSMLMFLYCIGLCIIPFFSSFVRSKKRRAERRLKTEQAEKKKRFHQQNTSLNRVLQEPQKTES